MWSSRSPFVRAICRRSGSRPGWRSTTSTPPASPTSAPSRYGLCAGAPRFPLRRRRLSDRPPQSIGVVRHVRGEPPCAPPSSSTCIDPNPKRPPGRNSMIKAPQQQVPGVYHRKVGDIVVTAITDGFLDGTLDVMRNIDAGRGARQILPANFRPARRTAVNTFLIYSAGRLALVETGSGNYIAATAGQVLAQPHGGRHRSRRHRDRAADAHAPRPFRRPHRHVSRGPRASATIPTPNWSCTKTSSRTGSTTQPWRRATIAEEALSSRPAASRSRPTRPLAPLQAGARCSPASPPCRVHGHTPGHTAYLIGSGNEQLLIWGDTVHVPEVQTARPEVVHGVRHRPAGGRRAPQRCSTWSRPTTCSWPACTCISRPSPTSCATAAAID